MILEKNNRINQLDLIRKNQDVQNKSNELQKKFQKKYFKALEKMKNFVEPSEKTSFFEEVIQKK